MKNVTPKKEQEEIKAPSLVEIAFIDPKGAERFTVHVKSVGIYTIGEVRNFGVTNIPYRLAAIMNEGDGVSLEFVKQQ